MHRHGAHAATDVTGFGILGHARNLALAQTADVCLRIDRLVVYKDTPLLAKEMPVFKLLEGYSAETSGGLLVCVPPENADAFVADMCAHSGPAWRVGEVVGCADASARDAYFGDSLTVLEI
jgi:selenide, water dikinase